MWTAAYTTYLDITRPAIQVQMQILDLSKIGKLVVQVLLASFFVYVRDDDNPALDRPDRCRIGMGGHRGVFRVISMIGFGGEGRIDFHFGVGHGDAFDEVVKKRMIGWWGRSDVEAEVG
jgi:hypothetical protein